VTDGTAGDFGTKIADSFLDLINNATSGDALEAQNVILRRIALQGDVVPSRVPPPRNITEIGGYLNLLGTLKETDMRSQVLAGILGVAGPNPPLGWLSTATPLTLVAMANDRPPGAVQPTLPVTIQVRSDFAEPLRAAIQALHDSGCYLPLLAGPVTLPKAGGNALPPPDPLLYVGRVLTLAWSTALVDPATDVLALARAKGSADPYEIAARAFGPNGAGVAAANYDALRCDETTCTQVALSGAKLVYVESYLSEAGFYPASPLQAPTKSTDRAWARFSNVTGLVPGVTKFGDELSLLHSTNAIAGSVFAGALNWVWDGSQFSSID
jgi:hypothetical protein